MPHTVCGIDLGSYSVKLALLEAGFRATTLRGLDEIMVPPGDAPLIDRQMQAAREALSNLGGEVTPYLVIPGDQLSVRVLELPFSEARKIDQVVGYELESQIVSPIEDVVFDHMVAAQRPEGTTVLAAAAKRVDLAAYLAAADAHGLHPRALFAGPVIYRSLFPSSPAAAPADGPASPCQAVVDFGHERTNVCVVRGGNAVFARTILRGGAHLTAAIARAFGADLDRAEQAKRGEAFLASPGRPADNPLLVKLDAVLREALAPTVRELRQTLASFSANSRQDVGALLVVGGGGRLAGLLPFLEAELGIPARYPSVREVLERTGRGGVEPGGEEVTAPEADVHALAGAIALAAARGSREIDFRRGPFAYRANYSILRQKAGHLTALAAAILIAGGVDVGAKLSSLRAERKTLDKNLRVATQELFGKPRDDAQAVTELLRRGFREELAPLPKATAFDLLDQISRKVPPADKVKLDVAELEIRPKKTFIKGTADTAAAVDEIASKLKEIDCFEDVTKGAITEVSGGAKQFTLTIGSKCP
jgi:general secretion pathway protein L